MKARTIIVGALMGFLLGLLLAYMLLSDRVNSAARWGERR
jgi:hypothetical protein